MRRGQELRKFLILGHAMMTGALRSFCMMGGRCGLQEVQPKGSRQIQSMTKEPAWVEQAREGG